jgi:hypothetical protein
MRGGFEIVGIVGDIDMMPIGPSTRFWVCRLQAIVVHVAEFEHRVKWLSSVRTPAVASAAGSIG